MDKTRFVRMRGGDMRAARSQTNSLIPLPTVPSSYDINKVKICEIGWYSKDGQCVDIDECLVFGDDCLESQRCLNLPGTFKCIRTLSCGTGYAMDSETEDCIDVDECNLGSHDCGPLYQCRNTQGSYRCDPKKCAEGELQNPRTGECISIDCPHGYYPANGMCNDVDECATGDQCGPGEECINTPGSFRCQQKGNICTMGYQVNENTGFCEDINECLNETICDGLQCINLPGNYKCRCNAGYEFNEKTKRCEDVDECEKFAGHVCDLSAECQNTVGSFLCKCKEGFELAQDGRRCEDINECAIGTANCEQKCINIPGSYQCICDRGYTVDINECAIGTANCEQKCINIPGSYQCICDRGYTVDEDIPISVFQLYQFEKVLSRRFLLFYPSGSTIDSASLGHVSGSDGRSCEDIDECAIWAGSGSELCMGGCINTKGSYICQCPPGYKIQPDGRTCVDIDECALGECQGEERICVNTLGHFKCHQIECPRNYVHDSNYKNRCNRLRSLCEGLSESICKARYPIHITWQYIAIPRGIAITSHRPTITLFTIKGPAHNDSVVQFELNLKRAIPESPNVLLAIRPNFLLQKGKERNSAVIAVRDTLDGPQTIEMELILRLNKKFQFTGKYVANLIVHVAPHKRHSSIFGYY
ncbi:calcium binding EGF domain protein [Dictyocaulus viviparus]|uniref:Fibulin-1 n=1 Tax=Dictyocaulus viviparus TaxID=29172 RepID=A0A0D8XVE7_DICVI|nr:calcium binding EGF domain protein [Dictyocaulus viviparus]